MRKRIVAIVVLAAGALAPGASAAPLTVRATFDSATVEFGDAFATHVVVTVDPSEVRAGSVRIVDDLAPLSPLSPAHVSMTPISKEPISATLISPAPSSTTRTCAS